MMSSPLLFLSLLCLALALQTASAAVVGSSSFQRVRTVEPRAAAASTAAPTSQLPLPIAYYTQAAAFCQQTYCNDSVAGLKVGDGKLLNTTGTGVVEQRVNVYHSKSLGIVVAYEGTTSSLISISYDADFILTLADASLNAPIDVLVDMGFQNAFLLSQSTVKGFLAAAKASYPKANVTIVGHSLGAAQAAIAAVAFRDEVSTVITFGQPRVGNPAFADFVDQTYGPSRLNYVVNGQDFVPHVPPQLIGYRHFSGQVWINPANTTSWKYYPGQENVQGANTATPQLNFDDHQGIYMHTQIGASQGHCPATAGQD